MTATELEQAPQEGRLVHPGEQQDIPTDRGLDQGIQDVAAPACLVPHQRRGTRVPAEEHVLVDADPERRPHLRERPVRDADDLETCQPSSRRGPAPRAAGPSRTIRRGRPARVSSSHSRLTDSDQPAAFWTSSITSTAPAGSVSRRAASHCPAIQSGPRRAGSSALTHRTGIRTPSTACSPRVVFPTCRGPATTWMNRRGSARRRASSAAWGRRYPEP